MDAMILPSAPASASAGNGIEMKAENQLNLRTMTGTGMNMITGLRIGEELQTGSNRPSLILRRTGKSSLWDMAKQTRSTVEQIRIANGLDSEPEEDRILLIPVS